MPDFRPPTPAAAAANLQRAEGAPVLGIAADATTPWSAAVGQEAALCFKVVNRGGPLRGLYVEIAGDAVSDHLVSIAHASADRGPTAEFSPDGRVLRAELPDATLDAGVTETGRPARDAQPLFDLVVVVRGDKPGSSLMTVRVGPLGTTGTSGSALAGRSFVVTEGSG
jgi:hypothetical protein